MAHNCPECYALCYCNGDIDDCCFDLPEDQNKCNHYLKCDVEESDQDWDEVSAPTDGRGEGKA